MQRLAYIDLAKAVAITLMILCHSGFQNIATVWIYAFHMPFFFIVSGYLSEGRAHRTSFHKWLKTKISALFVPYLLFGLIYSFGTNGYIDWCYIGYASRDSIQLAQSFTPLWFLPCFFFSSVLYDGIKRIMKNNKVLLYIVGGVGVIGWLLGRYAPMLGFPFSADIACVGVLLMAFGDMLAFFRREFPTIASDFRTIISMLVIGSAIAFINRPISLNPAIPHVEMSTGSFGCFPLFLMASAALSYTLIECSRRYSDKLGTHKRFLTIGEYSLSVLCIHGLLMTLSKHLVQLCPCAFNDVSTAIIETVVVILFSLLIIRVILPLAPNVFGLKNAAK